MAIYLNQLLHFCRKGNHDRMPGLSPVSADVGMAPKSEPQSLAIADLTKEPREPVTKEQNQRQYQKCVARVVANAARASGGTSGAGAEGHKKQNPTLFCAATTPLTGVVLKQMLRNEQDTKALCSVMYNNSHRAKPVERNVRKSSVQQEGRVHGLGAPFIWAWAGLIQGSSRKGRRDAGTAFGSLGRAEQIVDRGQVHDGQALSSRQNLPANTVQSDVHRGGSVSAFGGGKVAGKTRFFGRHWRESSKIGWRP